MAFFARALVLCASNLSSRPSPRPLIFPTGSHVSAQISTAATRKAMAPHTVPVENLLHTGHPLQSFSAWVDFDLVGLTFGVAKSIVFSTVARRRITQSSMCVKVTPLPKTSQARSASHVIEPGRAGEDIRTLCHFTFFHHAEIKNSGKSTSFEWQLFGWSLISVAICPGLNPELNQACNFQLLPLNKSWLPFVTNNIGLWHAYCIFKTNACIMQSRNGGVELQPREEFHIHWCTESQWQISMCVTRLHKFPYACVWFLWNTCRCTSLSALGVKWCGWRWFSPSCHVNISSFLELAWHLQYVCTYKYALITVT